MVERCVFEEIEKGDYLVFLFNHESIFDVFYKVRTKTKSGMVADGCFYEYLELKSIHPLTVFQRIQAEEVEDFLLSHYDYNNGGREWDSEYNFDLFNELVI